LKFEYVKTLQLKVSFSVYYIEFGVYYDSVFTNYTVQALLRNTLHCVGWGVKLYSLTEIRNGWTRTAESTSSIGEQFDLCRYI